MSTLVIPTAFDPAVIATALKRTAREAPGTTSFLKMEKSGVWVFGIDAEPVPPTAELAVGPASFTHGVVAWASAGGSKLAEVMVPVTEEVPELPPCPDGSNGWQSQLSVSMVLIKDGTLLLYRATSVGGKRMISALASEIADVISALGDVGARDDAPIVPVVTLGAESYKHQLYGKIYNPVFTIQRWISPAQLAQELKPPPALTPALTAEPKAKPKAAARARKR